MTCSIYYTVGPQEHETITKSTTESDKNQNSFVFKGTLFYLHLTNQSSCVIRNIAAMLINRGAYISSSLHKDVTHMLIDEDDSTSQGISIANRLPTTRAMQMIEESCKQNESVNLLNCSGIVAANRLGITTVMLSDIFTENDFQIARVSGLAKTYQRTMIANWLRRMGENIAS